MRPSQHDVPQADVASHHAGAHGALAPSVNAGKLEDHNVEPYIRQDPWPQKLLRRLGTVTGLWLLTAVWWCLAPFMLPILALIDTVRRVPLHWTRFYLCIGFIILGQSWGLLLLFGCWLLAGFGTNTKRLYAWSFACERYWAGWIVRRVHGSYGIQLTVENAACVRNGPTLLLVRHTSINDTILPIGILSTTQHVRLRIVLKAELLFAPIVDAIGHRFPTAFIKRKSSNPNHELDAIRLAATDMHRDETIMIFPEGTRFTESKRAELMAKMAAKDPVVAARAKELTTTLPLRLAGTEAMLAAAPTADVVFCAHTGYEHSGQLEDFIAGGLYRAHVRVKFWRVPRAAVPVDATARAAFFHEQWKLVDAFVRQHQAGRN